MKGLLLAIVLLEGIVVPSQDQFTPVESWNTVALAESECGTQVNEGIKTIIATYFTGDKLCTALRIVQCESLGDPDAVNKRSGASGLFQIMPFWADHFGYERRDLFDPVLNTEIATLVYEEQGWHAWSCY